MSAAEIERLKAELVGCRTYLEFGCGGSTVLAAQSPAARVVSVDNQREWVERCLAEPSVADRVRAGTATVRFVDTGPTGRWGKPADDSARDRWEDYSAGIWASLDPPPDVVLLDGRWRLACGLQALAHCDDDARILVHDWLGRKTYRRLLKHAELVDLVDTLAVLRPRPERKRSALLERARGAVDDPG